MGLSAPERKALGVVALLLTLGAAARYLQAPPPPVAMAGGPEISSAAEVPPSLETAEEVARARNRARPLAPGERIDVNRADIDELQRLPRVGPALAARIDERRRSRGDFRTLGDLGAVPGIGPALLAGVSPLVTLPAGPPSTGESAASPVHVNRATAEELQALPGIGPALAGRIVDWRARHGPFRSAADLQRVSGIGPRLGEQLAPRLDFSP
jgi:competence protein ComEA